MDDIGKARFDLLQELKGEVVGYLKREFNRAHTASLSSEGTVSVESEARVHELRSVICVIDGIFHHKETKLRIESENQKEGGGKALPLR